MNTLRGFSLLLYAFCCLFLSYSFALDTLKLGEVLQSNETLVSSNGVFELGFFGFKESSYKYLGVWFKNDTSKKAVWVANREKPLVDSYGEFKVRQDGNMVISDRRRTQIILNNEALAESNETRATILDSGNLILIQRENIIWQGFDYPTDTFLPGMKLGWLNLGTNQLRMQFLASWLSPFDPSPGPFLLGLDPVNSTQFNVWQKDRAFQQIGFWDGNTLVFFSRNSTNNQNFSFVSNGRETCLTFSNKDSNVLSWFVLASDGLINEFRMVGQEISTVMYSPCDDTLKRNSSGCLAMMPAMCKDGGNFSEMRGLMPASMVISWHPPSGLKDCELICKSNCSCVAYASLDDDGGTSCELYYGNKNDILDMKGRGKRTIYVRDDASKSGIEWVEGGMRAILPLFSSRLSIFGETGSADIIELSKKKDNELPLLRFSTLVAATNNFSPENKLGEGGFGPVYKGELQGYDIAVKRLSKNSGQGQIEFKNEIELISKLQHRNLVRLLGCCILRDEKIIIYEYMPNNSLDAFIFDPLKRPLLDWRKRRHIIEGIAQGLLYLHKYSRLRIIHRDLKTSNILLDNYLNPKISDFGMARIFCENESRAKTRRVVGTLGYMSPEYVVHGLFSTKSDVFSFGVILLEIVSGKRNASFHEPNSCLNLLGHAWDLWNAGKYMELMDPTLMAANSCPMGDFMLCIQVGLLCVQERAEDRPTMSDVVLMLSNEGMSLAEPKRPAFSTLLSVVDDSSSREETPSQNPATMSAVEAR
ncbi:Serine/threonine protein kinase [Trema orientale]|uniref:Receptor-like serine/threonine-protein kinase n=1 Tax=Trema orientale TaxID=63057 RepID=A0A2P5CM65_TREOI|nr:Serine/threonine protein kinase [Trema orientale]